LLLELFRWPTLERPSTTLPARRRRLLVLKSPEREPPRERFPRERFPRERFPRERSGTIAFLRFGMTSNHLDL